MKNVSKKHTFKENDFLGNIKNSKIYDTLIDYARSKGVPISTDLVEGAFESYPQLHFTENCLSANNWGDWPKSAITFEQFFEYCDNWLISKNSAFQTSDGVVHLNYKTKKVSCNGIDIKFETINELYKKVNGHQ